MGSREELRVGGRPPAAFWLGVTLKVGLVLLLLLPLLRPELEQYEGKGMSVFAVLASGAVEGAEIEAEPARSSF